MNTSALSFGPALGLLLLLVLLAVGVQWLKRRTTPAGSGQGASLRLVSHLALGPQQRVVVVEVNSPQGPLQLTLGVTPQHISALHTQAISPNTSPNTLPGHATPVSVTTPSYPEVVAALRSPQAPQAPQVPGNTP